MKKEDPATMATMQEVKRNDRLWPHIRPWAAASLAGVVSMILVCILEIAHPRAIPDFHQNLLVHVWPKDVPFRGIYFRFGVPFLSYFATFMTLTIRSHIEFDSIRDYAAYFFLSKAFAGISIVPFGLLFSAIQAKAGRHEWARLFGNQVFHIPLFLDQVQSFGFFPLQSVAFGLIACCIRRDRAAILAAGAGAMASLVMFLPAIPGELSGLKLSPFCPDFFVP
jgi:hypothetical protein